MTTMDVAAQAGVSERLIKNILADPEYNVKIVTGMRIARAIGVPFFLVFLPGEHLILNNLIKKMLRRQEMFFTVETLFNMNHSLQTLHDLPMPQAAAPLAGDRR